MNLYPVFVSKDARKTAKFYVDLLGFKYTNHFDKIESFATVYRDSIKFIFVQAKYGEVESTMKRYGAGYDAYIKQLYQLLIRKGCYKWNSNCRSI